MAFTHRRLRRKDLKQPDEFVSLIEAARQFLSAHIVKAIAGAAAIIVVAGAVLGVRLYQQHRSAAAANQFYDAFNALDAKDYKFAEQLFGKLAASQSNLQVGRLARFYQATCNIEQGKLAEARDALKLYLANQPEPLFANLATINLAIVYERLGELKQAEATYREVARMHGPEQLRAELGLARVLMQAGKRQGAIDVYRNFLAKHPYTLERQEAMETLAQLGVSPDVPALAASNAHRVPVPAAPASH